MNKIAHDLTFGISILSTRCGRRDGGIERLWWNIIDDEVGVPCVVHVDLNHTESSLIYEYPEISKQTKWSNSPDDIPSTLNYKEYVGFIPENLDCLTNNTSHSDHVVPHIFSDDPSSVLAAFICMREKVGFVSCGRNYTSIIMDTDI